jgi:hypothetical protein
MAPYQNFKLFLVDALGVTKDGFHIVLGFLVLLIFARLFSLKLNSWKVLIAPILFAILLEVLDVHDALQYHYRINWLDSLHDIVLTVLLPTLLVAYNRYIQRI